MNKTALSLFLLGVISVNAGSVTSHSSGSRSGDGLGILHHGLTASGAIQEEVPMISGGAQPWSADSRAHRDCLDNNDEWWH